MATESEIKIPDIAGKVFEFSVLPSTQMKAVELLEAGESLPFSVIANAQSNGVGRLGRNWFSPYGGIYISWAAEAKIFDAEPMAIAIAVCRAISGFTGKDAVIKWPNDIMIDGKKLAGILAQKIDGNVITGIGINTFDSDAISKYAESKMVSISLSSRQRREFIVRIFEEIEPIWKKYQKLGFAAFVEQFISLSFPQGTKFRVSKNDINFLGTFVGITEKGELLLEVNGETEKFRAGEISIVMDN